MKTTQSSLSQRLLSLLNEPIGLLGFGVEGQSTGRFLQQHGFGNITVFDKKKSSVLPDGMHYVGGDDYLSRLPTNGTLFRSAGIREDLPEIALFKSQGGIVTSQIELFLKLFPPDHIIGITGTLGKGTCCSLLHHICKEAGIPSLLGGNIGTAALDLAEKMTPDTYAILELSSFQLSSLKQSPGYAAVLKTTCEHLDWHLSQAEYWDCKANIVRFQKPEDVTVYYDDTEGSRWIAAHSGGQAISYGTKGDILVDHKLKWKNLSLSFEELAMPGRFNLQNAAAASCLAVHIGVPFSLIKKAITTFKGLEHRLEYVRTFRHISFYNDSYATRPDATIGALRSFSQEPIGLILGGSEKYADFSELAAVICQNPYIRAIALIGESGRRILIEIEKDLPSGAKSIQILPSLEDAITYLLNHIKSGIILLSPACASFGLFANYKERGKIFKHLVSLIK